MSLLEVENLVLSFPVGHGRPVAAVNDVSFVLEEGKTLGLVGESGCGKSTLARTLLRLYTPSSGKIRLEGQNLLAAKGMQLQNLRRMIQMVFQDPFSSLDPRQTVGDAIMEPMKIFKLCETSAEYEKRCAGLFDIVGLSQRHIRRFPHEFSGGQLQRVGIARALSLSPKIIVADEPVSALDVSIQAQILNLFQDLQREMNLALIFISHDLALIRHMSDDIAVMYKGEFVEYGNGEQVCTHPGHDYTKMLIGSIPSRMGCRH